MVRNGANYKIEESSQLNLFHFRWTLQFTAPLTFLHVIDGD